MCATYIGELTVFLCDSQVYVDQTPIAYPMNYVLNFTMSIIIGGVLFIIYLWYFMKHHKHRIRTMGPLCQDIYDMQYETGSYTFPRKEERTGKMSEGSTTSRASKRSSRRSNKESSSQ